MTAGGGNLIRGEVHRNERAPRWGVAKIEEAQQKMMALNMNQLALAAGGNSTPFGIGMPTPMDDTRQRINDEIKKGPCPFDLGGPPGITDTFWVLVQLGYIKW